MRGVRLRADLARSGAIPAGLDDNQAEAYRADVETARRLSQLLRDRNKDEGNAAASGATRASIAREYAEALARLTALETLRPCPAGAAIDTRDRGRLVWTRRGDRLSAAFGQTSWHARRRLAADKGWRPVGRSRGVCDRRPRPAKPLQLAVGGVRVAAPVSRPPPCRR